MQHVGFYGGELFVQADDGKNEITVQGRIRGAPGLQLGSKVRGKIVSSRGTWVRFVSLRPHQVRPITHGTRISLNYFTRLAWQKMSAVARLRLEAFALPLPTQRPTSAAGPRRTRVNA